MRISETAKTAVAVATLVAASAALCAQTPTPAKTPAPSDAPALLQRQLHSLFAENKKSVVKVYAQKQIISKDAAGHEARAKILDVGSGFIASKTGAIMTSAFVTRGAQKLWVEYDGKLLDAESVGFDPLTTVSIIKISGNFKSADLPVVVIDKNAEPVEPATLLVAISHEMGLPAAPRMGLAAGQNIEFGGRFLPTVYVRTNIPAPRGSTGGAVFSLDGKFAGMIVASIPEVGGSFILPARAAAKIRDDIMICGEPIYSWFGMLAKDVPDPAEGSKVVVDFVAENAPAKKAGFRAGDEIVEINSAKVSNNTQLRQHTFFIRPKETAVFKVRRGSETVKLELITERMSGDVVKAAQSAPTLAKAPAPAKAVATSAAKESPATATAKAKGESKKADAKSEEPQEEAKK